MKRHRRNHQPAFKARVALDALKGDLTLAELAQKHDVHANPITEWKKQLLKHADQAFGNTPVHHNADAQINALQAKIGQLTMENDFLEQGLTRIHGPRGKGW